MPIKVWNGSSWVAAKSLQVWNGSSWASSKSGSVWNGTSWVSFFSGVGTPSLSNHTISSSAYGYNNLACSALSQLKIANDKLLSALANANGDNNTMIIDGIDYDNPSGTSGWIAVQNWLSAGGDVSLWSCQAVPISGTPDAGSSATNTWLSMSTDRSWSATAASNSSTRLSSKTFNFTLQLALSSDTSTVLASATMQLSATSQTDASEEP